MVDQEVSDEEQAAAYLKLQDNVRQLIRDELKLALEDSSFWWVFNGYLIRRNVFNNVEMTESLRQAVKSIVKTQMEKY